MSGGDVVSKFPEEEGFYTPRSSVGSRRGRRLQRRDDRVA